MQPTLKNHPSFFARERWSHGRPAWMAVVAACVVLLYSRIWVQPSVTAKYRSRCEELLAELDQNQRVDTAKETAVAVGEDPNTDSLFEKYRLVNVHLKRLIETPEHRDWARYRLGVSAAANGRLLSAMSNESARRGDRRTAFDLQNQAYVEHKRASETMRILSRSDAAESDLARAWLISESLPRSVRDASKLDELEKSAREVLRRHPDDVTARARLGQLLVMRAYAVETELTTDARLKLTREAVERFASLSSPELVASAYYAEALAAEDGERAIEISSRVAQAFWQTSTPEQRTPEVLAAMISSLVRLGSLGEVQSLLGSRIGTLLPQDAVDTLRLVSDATWRQLVSRASFPVAEKQEPGPLQLIDLIMQVEPRSTELAELINAHALNDASEPRNAILGRFLEADVSSPLCHYIQAYRAALREDWQAGRTHLQAVPQSPAHFPLFFATVASAIADEDPSKTPITLRFHEQLTRVAPQSIQTWLERIAFCMRHNEHEKALESADFLRSKAADNPMLLDTLAALYSKLGQEAAAAEIRSRLAELNKSKTK